MALGLFALANIVAACIEFEQWSINYDYFARIFQSNDFDFATVVCPNTGRVNVEIIWVKIASASPHHRSLLKKSDLPVVLRMLNADQTYPAVYRDSYSTLLKYNAPFYTSDSDSWFRELTGVFLLGYIRREYLSADP